MPGLRAEFYADDEDIRTLLVRFRELGDLKYVEQLSSANAELQQFTDPLDLFGCANLRPEAPNVRRLFTVLDGDAELSVREVEMADGSGLKKSISQYMNPDSVVLSFGGEVGDGTIVMSDITTIGDTVRAREMHKAFKKLITESTQRVGSKGALYRLMPGAVAKLKGGWRLAREKRQPENMDPKISAEEIAAL